MVKLGQRIAIAGTTSGVGKTSVTLGLARSLARRELRVQTFKVGPDFLDPTYLAMASGRPCYNLDGWMTSREYVCELFDRATADADIAIIEGVMGLFDGASPDALDGSTAEIARWLDAPVLLVVDAHGAARSLAATVQGFVHFEPGVQIAGVIANRCGSDRHRDWLARSLDAAHLPPLVGAIPRDSLPRLENRHLGLVAAEHSRITPELLDQLADAVEKCVDMGPVGNALRGVPRAETRSLTERRGGRSLQQDARIGIARDQAFHFYYPDNLEALEAAGAKLVEFSPLADDRLPADLDAILLGGGYPEAHARRLAANESMRCAIADFAASGRPLYAECGGLMYLSRAVTTLDGERFPMAGVIPIETVMQARLAALGYVEATLTTDGPLGPAGQICRGHEFHYSHVVLDESESAGWLPAFSIERRRADAIESHGYARGNVVAVYLHLHWASRPDWPRRFLETCKESR